MADGNETAKIVAAATGTGILGFLWGLLRFEGKFVRKGECDRNQSQCTARLEAILSSMQADIKDIKETQRRFFADFYRARVDR